VFWLKIAGQSKNRNPKHLPARSRFGEGRRNSKWFDQLTTLSHVEGQCSMIKIQMTKTAGRWVSVWNIGVFVL